MENKSKALAAGASIKKQRTRINTNVQKNGKININNRFYYQVLRAVGYDVYSAIPELVDNALDAKATEINIEYSEGILTISDNGNGMDVDQLTNAMDIGSEQQYTNEKIGHFGTGMKSAVMNLITDKTKSIIIESSDGKDPLGLLWKPNESFLDYEGPYKADHKQTKLGTVIRIDNCQRFQLPTLKRTLGCMYYPVLKTETVKIFVNDEQIRSTDPLYRDSDKTLHNHLTAKVLGHEISIHGVLLSTTQEKSNWDSQTDKEEGRFAFSKSGAYVQYGCRYVEMGGLLNVLFNHPKFNHFRFEFTIPKELTEAMHLKFNKTHGLNLSPKREDNQALSDLIQKIKDAAKWAEKTHLARREKTDNTPEEQQEINELEKQLNSAARRANVRRPRTSTERKNKPAIVAEETVAFDTPEEREQIKPESTNKAPKIYEYNAFSLRFEDMGSTAVFWDLSWENNKFIIAVNKGHVFYREFWVNMNETARKSIAFLLAAIAQSQYDDITQAQFNEGRGKQKPEDFWIDFWSQVSLKLRNLVN